MTNSETKNFSQNVSSSYHLGGKCSNGCKKDSLNVPKLRFKGYNEEWKHLNFKSITTMIKDGTHGSYNDLSEGIPLLSAKDIDNGKVIIPDDCRRISLSDYNDIYKNYSLKINDILLTIVGTIGRVALVSDITNKYAFQRSVGILRANEYNNPQFILYLLQTDFIKKQFYSKVNQSAQGGIYLDTLGKIDFKIPTLPEQEKIASFLTLIDKKIEKQKELVELLKKYKRGLLSQIFSQKLRFKDKNGNDYQEWEECKFDEIFQILGNNTLSRECLNYTNIGVKNIHYGDILVKYHTCINDEIDKIPNINSDINLNKIPDDNYLTVGDVILADTAEDYTVGKTCEIVSCKTKILSGLHTIPCRPKQYFAKGYLGYYLNSAEYHDKLIPLITGIKVSAISKKEIKKTIIKYPVYNEQKKIANLLLLIENKLNLNIKRLELFETYKKGLLQQLFI